MRKNRIFIIAEAGVNHNGDLGTALRLVDAAASTGADAVKFQTFRADLLASRAAPKAEYQKGCAGTHYEMLKSLELSVSDHSRIMRRCKKRGIEFISSPFDTDSVDLLLGLGTKILKIPSGEITDLPLLRKVGSSGRKIMLSTGMSTMREIGDAVRALLGSGARKRDIVLLQCNSQYPTPFEDANLNAMLTIRESLGMSVGYSDHTLGIEAAVAAAAIGADVIEKHITLSHHMSGPDHKASLEPNEFRRMVDAIRNVEAAMGDGIKRPTTSERPNIKIGRKSIVAARDISAGDKLTRSDLTAMRPGSGISPMLIDRYIGRMARRSYRKGEAIVR